MISIGLAPGESSSAIDHSFLQNLMMAIFIPSLSKVSGFFASVKSISAPIYFVL